VKRLLSIIVGPVFGGAHNQALRLAEPLRERGWSTSVVLPPTATEASAVLAAAGVEVTHVPMARPRLSATIGPHVAFARDLRRQIRRIRAVVRAERADVVQIHGPLNPHAALAARIEGAAVVVQLLDTRPPVLARYVAMPFVHLLADSIMATGLGVAEVYPSAMRFGDRLIPYAPPVDIEQFRSRKGSRSRARQLLRVGSDDVVVGSVGNRNPQKGFDHLFSAMGRLRIRHPNLQVRVRGTPSVEHPGYDTVLAAAARTAGFDPVDVIDTVPPDLSVADIMPGFDVFVVSSVPRSEGIPTVIIEAMAAGIPVVTTRVGAVSEVVEEGRTGLIVPPEDPTSLAAAVERLLVDLDLRVSMSHEVQAEAIDRFGLDRCADAHARAYMLAHARRTRI
jgi:glycosyltransferase involved in cell wall biosynthesis